MVLGTVESESHSYATEELEYRDGFSTDVFDLKHVDTITRSNPSSCAATYGIGKSTDITKNSLEVPLETVTLVEEEEVTEPHMRAVDPETSPELGDKLTYTDGLIFHRKKQTLTINGKGDPPVGLGTADRGNTYSSSITLKPAVGGSVADITEGSGFYLRRVEITKANTEWQKFMLELVKYVPNTADNAQVNMITPEFFGVDAGDLTAISAWYKLSRTITLNGEGAANVEETAEIYDDVAAA